MMHKAKPLFILVLLILMAFSTQGDFLSEQKKHAHVKTAYQEKNDLINKTLAKLNLRLNDLQVLFVAYKEEQELHIYAKNKTEVTYKAIGIYPICAKSGTLGPKRRQGDNQVPEGFYHIDRFNPESFYYLSLGINYPNAADRKKSTAKNLGGDIFIHGSCVTIGCLPMTDDKIKEIYIYAIQARQNGQLKIPVYLFPFIMTNEKMEAHKVAYKNNSSLISFWTNLKTGYDLFQKDKTEIKFTISNHGDYLF